MVKFSKCCNPLPGDSIIGFVTKGYGISIHKRDCPNVIEGQKRPEDAHRWVEARWESRAVANVGNVYEALIQIFVYDRISILADITVALAEMKVSILQINSQLRSDGRAILNLKVSCKNIEHLKSIVSRLKQLPDVEDVTRGFS